METIKAFFAYWIENVKEAREKHELLMWLFFALALGASVIFRIADPHGTEAKVAGWLLVTILIWSVFWLPFKRHQMLEEKIQPKLKLACGTEIPGSKVPTVASKPFLTSNSASSPPFGGIILQQLKATWLRVLVTTERPLPLKNCRGTLREVRKDGEVLVNNETLPLTFKDGDSANLARTISVSAGMPVYLDILGITEDNAVAIQTPNPPNSLSQTLFNPVGTYILQVAVGSDESAPIMADLEFIWAGDWQTAELKLIRQYPWPSSKSVGV